MTSGLHRLLGFSDIANGVQIVCLLCNPIYASTATLRNERHVPFRFSNSNQPRILMDRLKSKSPKHILSAFRNVGILKALLYDHVFDFKADINILAIGVHGQHFGKVYYRQRYG